MEKNKYFWLAIITLSLLILFFILSYINQIFQLIPFIADSYWSLYGTYINGVLGIILSIATVIFIIFNFLEQKEQNRRQNEYYEEQREFLWRQNFDNNINNHINQYYKLVESLKDTEHIHYWRDLQFVDTVRGISQINSETDNYNVKETNMEIFSGKILYLNTLSKNFINHRCLVNFGFGKLFLKNLYLFMKGGYEAYVRLGDQNLTDNDRIKINFDNHLKIYRPVLSNYFSTVFRIFTIINEASISGILKQDYQNQFLDTISYYELPLIYYYAYYTKIKNENEKYYNILKNGDLYKEILSRIQTEELFKLTDVDYYDSKK